MGSTSKKEMRVIGGFVALGIAFVAGVSGLLEGVATLGVIALALLAGLLVEGAVQLRARR